MYKKHLLTLGIGLTLALASCQKPGNVEIGEFKNISAQERTIEITGSADMNVDADEAEFLIGIREYFEEEFQKGTDRDDYKTKIPLKGIEKDLMRILSDAGIDNKDIIIESAGSYYGRYSGRSYQMSKQYKLKVTDLSIIDKLIPKLNFRGLDYMRIGQLKNKDIKKFREEVKKEAIIAAKKKAEYLTESLGKTIGEVISIKEINNDNGWPSWSRGDIYSNSTLSSNASSSSVESNLRSIKLRYEIGVTFEIK